MAHSKTFEGGKQVWIPTHSCYKGTWKHIWIPARMHTQIRSCGHTTSQEWIEELQHLFHCGIDLIAQVTERFYISQRLRGRLYKVSISCSTGHKTKAFKGRAHADQHFHTVSRQTLSSGTFPVATWWVICVEDIRLCFTFFFFSPQQDFKPV